MPQKWVISLTQAVEDGAGMIATRSVQTLAGAYHAICAGAMTWVALGDFMNEWFDYSRERRVALVAEPLTLPAELSPELHRWATFCAAAAEWLTARYAVPCPAWVHDSTWCLPEPWFDAPQAQKPEVRAWLIASTPEPFTRRNIFCGDRTFATKYDFATTMRRRRSGRATDQDQEIAAADPD